MPYDSTIFQLQTPLAAQNLASSATSGIVDLREATNFAVQPVASGSSILGSIQLLGSCDSINFGAMGSAITLPAGNLLPVNYEAQGIGWVKVQFTNASGVGALTINIS